MLSLNNFSKSYSGRLVIRIDAREFGPGLYWIKGENGSGKTTLFKSLAGLHPCSGDVAFDDGIRLHQNPVEYRRVVTYAEAEPEYPGFLTGKDLIRFVGKARKALPQHYERANLFGIKEYYKNPCDTYSSGMLKKLSLSLAFLGATRLIILDEPLITLDENARKTLFILMAQYLKDNRTILMVSSHQSLEDHSLPPAQTFIVRNQTLEPV